MAAEGAQAAHDSSHGAGDLATSTIPSGTAGEGALADAPSKLPAGDQTIAPPGFVPASAGAFQSVAQVQGTLHTAARSGNLESMKFLLRQRADLAERDSEGLTALQIAEAANDAEMVQLLRENGATASMPPSPSEAPRAAEASKTANSSSADRAAPGAPAIAQSRDHHEAAATQRSGPQSPLLQPQKRNNKSASAPSLGSFQDLKDKTASISAMTVDGVVKGRPTYLASLSKYKSGPKYTMGPPGQCTFIRSSNNPAPGSYNLPDGDRDKYKRVPRYSFGAGSRFGLGTSPAKMQPGPGAYNPSDPVLKTDPKVGFGTSLRGHGALIGQANPGPGAYECRNTVGGGKMFTAGGRHPASYMRARSMPGPGAYNPSTHGVFNSSLKVGFGTSTRDDVAARARNLVMPGPGTYELQNFKTVGAEAPKFSATSRRRLQDLSSYVTPGPGSYNAHLTNFGEPVA